MSYFPGNPKSMRGAIFCLRPPSIIPTLVVFQYNPSEVSRTITPHGSSTDARGGAGWARNEEPDERMSFSADLNSADQPPGSVPGPFLGLHPQLSALEALLYSSLDSLIPALPSLSGTVDILSGTTQITLLILGPARVVPVELTSLTVTEQDFDEWLNPIRATLKFDFKILTSRDLVDGHPAAEVHKVYQTAKGVMAAASSVSSVGSFLGSLPL